MGADDPPPALCKGDLIGFVPGQPHQEGGLLGDEQPQARLLIRLETGVMVVHRRLRFAHGGQGTRRRARGDKFGEGAAGG